MVPTVANVIKVTTSTEMELPESAHWEMPIVPHSPLMEQANVKLAMAEL
jgi:hypothetical protein